MTRAYHAQQPDRIGSSRDHDELAARSGQAHRPARVSYAAVRAACGDTTPVSPPIHRRLRFLVRAGARVPHRSTRRCRRARPRPLDRGDAGSISHQRRHRKQDVRGYTREVAPRQRAGTSCTCCSCGLRSGTGRPRESFWAIASLLSSPIRLVSPSRPGPN